MKKLFVAAAASIACWGGSAAAGVIEFDPGTGYYGNYMGPGPDYVLTPMSWNDHSAPYLMIRTDPTTTPFSVESGSVHLQAGQTLLIVLSPNGLRITGFDAHGAGELTLTTQNWTQSFALDDQPGFETLTGLAPTHAQYWAYPHAMFKAGASEVWLDNIHFEAVSVPEPSTWAMMIIGFGLIGSSIRRSLPALASSAVG